MTKDELNNRICSTIHICNCNRYTDRLFVPLKKLLEKLINNVDVEPSKLTDEELLIIALLDARVKFVTHGINIEYPIVFKEDAKVLIDNINKYFELTD